MSSGGSELAAHENGSAKARLVAAETELAAVAQVFGAAPRLAFDLESNGLFRYRPTVCTVQLSAGEQAVIVDAKAVDIAGLRVLLGESGPVKIVHDVSFDARMLAEAGVTLGNVHDTAIAARMLGRVATGLASLVQAEFGVTLDKSMQQHDWTLRPLEERELSYLSADVAYLEALDERIWTQVVETGIEAEVLEETAYRISGAVKSAGETDDRPAYARLKGAERHALLELAILRELCNVRETVAREVDLPVHKIMANEALQAIARSRPRTVDELRKIRGVPIGVRHGLATSDILRAVERGITSGTIPDAERAWFERPRIPAEVIRQRRGRETRLMQWRKEEAKRRGVDEQVVLPGHCVKDLAEAEGASMREVEAVPGIGQFRIERDGASILLALAGP